MIHLLQLDNVPILEQLQIEEALLRADDQNWCILNSGSEPAIVMGISGKKEQLISATSTTSVIKRFSGGGTVIVDHNTCFVTTIMNHQAVNIEPFPKQVLHWNGELYQNILADFEVVENDYTLHQKKFGGNAQYFTKQRWLHHTTLLWDYDKEKMDQLLYPPKTPQYRENRSHKEFLCTLKEHFSSKEEMIEKIAEELSKKFPIKKVSLDEIEPLLKKEHRRATKLLSSSSMHNSL